MRLGTMLLAAARRGLVRGTSQFVEHLVRNLLLLITALIFLYFGGSYFFHWLGSFLPHFPWPDWLHWPHWFGNEAAADVTVPVPVTIETILVPPSDACNGWGYRSWCWKN